MPIALRGSAPPLLIRTGTRRRCIDTDGVVVTSSTFSSATSQSGLAICSLGTSPTAADIFGLRVFEEPLCPTGDPTDAENRDLTAALRAFMNSPATRNYTALWSFVRARPKSVWNIALLTNMGIALFRTGSYSGALTAWREACDLALLVRTGAGKPIADRAIGEYAALLARIGRMQELSALFALLPGRVFCGPATEAIAGARGGLAAMRQHPGMSFRCGPLALHRVLLSVRPEDACGDVIAAAESTNRGLSLANVADLSDRVGLHYQMAFRTPGAPLIAPAVVHLRVEHFAAVISRDGDRYLVEDPTFRTDAWMTAAVLTEESTGYFLVPSGELPFGWRPVARDEGEKVWGKGDVDSPPIPPGGCDPSTDSSSCPPAPPCAPPGGGCGMPVPKVFLLDVSLNLTDIPLGYQPSVGPAINLTLRYNQRDQQFASTFNYSNLGPKWTFDWLAFIRDDPTNVNAVTYYMMGGGNRNFAGFDPAAASYNQQPLDLSRLQRTSPHAYELQSPDGTRRVFAASDNGVTTRRIFLTALIDPAGNAVAINYDANMRITSIVDAVDQTTTLHYDNPADIYKITSISDPFGRTVKFGYNSDGMLASITDAMNITSRFTYELGGSDFITELTTPYGTTQFTKTENGQGEHIKRSLEILYPDQTRERVEFNQDGSLTGILNSDPPSVLPTGMLIQNSFLFARNTFHWDRQACAYGYGDYSKARIYHWAHTTDLRSASGFIESYKPPLESRIWYNYPGQQTNEDAFREGTLNRPTRAGRVLDDGITQLYSYAYDDNGNLITTVDPVGRSTSYVYSDNGIDLIETRQTRGGQSELLSRTTYDPRHRPLSITDTAGNTTTFTYNDRGQMKTITTPLSETTTYNYDPSGNGQLKTIDGPLFGQTRSYTYDGPGRVRTVTDESNYTLTYDYDDLNRVTQVTYPDNTFEHYTYTTLDITEVLDRAGRVTHYQYDSNRRVTMRTDPLGRSVRNEWCKCGSLRRLTDPLGRTTTWRHDIQGRTTEKQYPDGATITFRYEKSTSRLLQRIDEKLQITHYTYSPDDRARSVQYLNAEAPTSTVTFTDDPDYPRITSMTDGTGTTTYTYHPISPIPTLGAGQLRSITAAATGAVLSYGYDELGRRAITGVDGSNATMHYDSAGRIAQQDDPLGSTHFNYDGVSPRPKLITLPNGQTIEYNYHSAVNDYALQRISNRDQAGTIITESSFGPPTPNGLITSWSEQTGARPPTASTFQYDDADQLRIATVTQSGTTINTLAYDYDAVGNLTSTRTGATPTTFAYNALNQLVSKEGGTDSTAATYTWDGEHRLVSVTSGPASTIMSYDGNRALTAIRHSTNGTDISDRRFVSPEGVIREERTANGQIAKRFYDGGFSLEGGPTAGQYFYARDHLGSVRGLTDIDGTVRADYIYDPWGACTKVGGDLEADHRYAGMFWIDEAALHHTAFRWYDSTVARWLSRDPLDNAETRESPNLYSYVTNDPIARTDPSGLAGVAPGCPDSGPLAIPAKCDCFKQEAAVALALAKVAKECLPPYTKSWKAPFDCIVGEIALGIALDYLRACQGNCNKCEPLAPYLPPDDPEPDLPEGGFSPVPQPEPSYSPNPGPQSPWYPPML
jgi:RHS repeat-associated protein